MKIAVLTSGGDAPGMNAAIRTIGMIGAGRGHEVVGVRHGYAGLLRGDVIRLDPGAVEGVTRMGGTILGSSRCLEMMQPEGQARAREQLASLGIDGLIVIGGNGSLTGAHVLAKESPCKIVGLPASIDNDIGHTGLAIGVDTAVNTIVEACDRIADTARAHRRVFLVEVMGRKCGFLAMRAGLAAEADAILFGEDSPSEDQIVERLRGVLRKCFAPGSTKNRALIVRSEGLAVAPGRLVTWVAADAMEYVNGRRSGAETAGPAAAPPAPPSSGSPAQPPASTAGSVPGPAASAAPCKTHLDCTGGLVCPRGQCIQPSCVADKDCGAGQFCTLEGVCEPVSK